MASFAYSAINAQGVELSGEIHAADLGAARELLRVKGLLAQSIKELADAGSGLGQTSIGNKKVKAKSLQIFLRQVAAKTRAGRNGGSRPGIAQDHAEEGQHGADAARRSDRTFGWKRREHECDQRAPERPDGRPRNAQRED